MRLRINMDAVAGGLRRRAGETPFPTAIDGARTMTFIETALERHAAGGRGLPVEPHLH